MDLVLFCVKAYDTSAAAALIRPLIGAETLVLPLQNGVYTVECLAAVVGSEHVVGGVAVITLKTPPSGVQGATGCCRDV